MVKYRYKTMNDEYNQLMQRIKAGEQLSVLEQKKGVALGHAIDFSEFARSNEVDRVRLDFTIETESKIDKALYLLGMEKMNGGSSEEECIEYLVQITSYYQLFALCNYVEDYLTGTEVSDLINISINYDEAMSENLILKVNGSNDVDIIFDPKMALESVVDKCIFFTEIEGADDNRGLVIGLDNYRDKVVEQLLSQIQKSI